MPDDNNELVRRRPVAEDRLVRDLLLGAGFRVHAQEDQEEFRDLLRFMVVFKEQWEHPENVKDREFIRERRLTWERRSKRFGKVGWLIFSGLGGLLLTMLGAYIQTRLAR